MAVERHLIWYERYSDPRFEGFRGKFSQLEHITYISILRSVPSDEKWVEEKKYFMIQMVQRNKKNWILNNQYPQLSLYGHTATSYRKLENENYFENGG